VGEPREQVFDRDLLHLVYGGCVGSDVEATVRHAKEFLKRSQPKFPGHRPQCRIK
jgi:hypothetical protein